MGIDEIPFKASQNLAKPDCEVLVEAFRIGLCGPTPGGCFLHAIEPLCPDDASSSGRGFDLPFAMMEVHLRRRFRAEEPDLQVGDTKPYCPNSFEGPVPPDHHDELLVSPVVVEGFDGFGALPDPRPQGNIPEAP